MDSGTPFQVTATGSTSAVATKIGAAGKTSYLVDVSGSSDKAGAKVLVKDGTTVIWQDIVGVGYYQHSFAMPINATAGADLSVTVDGTSLSNANMSGYSL